MLQISPSILSADFSRLEREVADVEAGGAHMLHIDVMDGHFVPNISFGACVVSSLRPKTQLFFDVHLMISDPLAYAPSFAKAGADMITFHYESDADARKTIDVIRGLGLKVGMAVKPGTDVSVLEPFLPQLDLALVTSSSSPEELISNLKGTEYYDPLMHLGTIEHPTLFDYEMTLDLYYFCHLWKQREKIARKKDLEELTKAWGSKFDMLNLQWIYRSKQYYHMTAADIYALIIPVHYRLSQAEVQALVEAEDMEAFRQLIGKTYYAKHFEAFSAETMEAMYAQIMKHILSTASRSNPYSLATVYSYLYHKDHEINRLIIALECVRYSISPDEAMQYVAKT